MRLFIGINLPWTIKNYLSKATIPLKQSEKGWEHCNDYHVTMLFIGETSVSIDIIRERMQKIRFTPFEVSMEEFCFFPRRVMYLNVHPLDPLIKLKMDLKSEFPEYVRSNERPFLPHITIKRWQRYEFDELKKRVDRNPLRAQSFLVNELTLFKAQKDNLDRKYHALTFQDKKKGPEGPLD